MNERKKTLYSRMDDIANLMSFSEKDGVFFGVVAPPKDSSIFDYNKNVLGFYCYLNENNGECSFFACYFSIDDSGCSIFGPVESKEKAQKRFDMFKQKQLVFGSICPDKDVLVNWTRNLGLSVGYW